MERDAAMERDEAMQEGLRRSNERFMATMDRILDQVSCGRAGRDSGEREQRCLACTEPCSCASAGIRSGNTAHNGHPGMPVLDAPLRHECQPSLAP